MKVVNSIIGLALLLPFSVGAANAPLQQKVVREVVIKADPAKVWALVKDFGGMHQWHPAVASTKLDMRKDENGEELQHRLLTLKDGGTILEKLVAAKDEDMKLEYRIVEGALPVSGYKSIMQVKPGPAAGESPLTWTGRFYNKAYLVDAPKGEDNEAALKAVEGVYDSGLPALKKQAEGS